MIDRLQTITHTEYCSRATEQWQKLNQRFSSQWPNHCQTCYGLGGYIYYYDPSPAGISLGAGFMEDFNPCPDCVESGNCPRCGEHFFEGDDDWLYGGPMTCPSCGWNDETADRHSRYILLPQLAAMSDIHAIPPEPECYCYEDARW